MRRYYEYSTMSTKVLLGCLSSDPGLWGCGKENIAAYQSLLAGGFRWVRTDGEVAVFERESAATYSCEHFSGEAPAVRAAAVAPDLEMNHGK